jgi:diacylglycerol kinase (ATP)
VTRVLLISNPASGSADAESSETIEASLRALGDLRVIKPGKVSFDQEVRSAAEKADVVVTAGGDGSLNYTLNALHDALDDLTLALIPMGTGNDLARTLGLADDPINAATSLERAATRTLDVGRAAGPGVERLFINACMGGFPVRANEAIDEKTKKRLGPVAFLVGGAKALTDFSTFRVVIDGVEVSECIAAGVGNGRTCGGGMEVWPRAQPDDGVLDACVLASSTLPAAIRVAARVKAGTHEELDEVVTRRAPNIKIEADPPIEFNVDGELVDLHSPATFELVTRARFLVPDAPRPRESTP